MALGVRSSLERNVDMRGGTHHPDSFPEIYQPQDGMKMCFIVERGGYEAETAGSGEEGLALLREATFDAVLLDLDLPGISGADVLHEIRANPAWRELMVIVLSGHCPEGGETYPAEQGATAQCPKPVAPSTLLAELEPLRSDLRTRVAP